jgi:hypothetical protein
MNGAGYHFTLEMELARVKFAVKRLMSRAAVVVPVLAISLLWSAHGTQVHAQKSTTTPTTVTTTVSASKLAGQITNIMGTSASPTGFTLQLGLQTWTLQIPLKGIIRAQSAEADVEGLVTNDYASVDARLVKIVDARSVRYVLYAQRTLFDVQPVMPLRLFVGTVVRVSPDGRRITIRLDLSRTVVIHPGLMTRYRVDSRATDIPPTLVKGTMVDILARRMGDGSWVAYDLNLRSISLGNGRSSLR